MNMKELKEIFKKAFGKERDSRVHAIVMLSIYTIFMVVLVAFIRFGNNNVDEQKQSDNPTPTDIKTQLDDNNQNSSNINYTYSYIINYDDQKETYLGSRINNKQKFTCMKNDTILEYAKVGDNYLIKNNDTFHLSDKLDSYFEYCDLEKIKVVLKDYYNLGTEAEEKYIVNTSDIASGFNKELTSYCGASTNNIDLIIENGSVKEVNMNLDNYISCIDGGSHTLNIKMEFTSIGTTEDFEIKMD